MKRQKKFYAWGYADEDLTPEEIKTQMARLKRAAKKTPLVLSAHSGAGVKEALRALRAVVDGASAPADGTLPENEPAWHP